MSMSNSGGDARHLPGGFGGGNDDDIPVPSGSAFVQAGLPNAIRSHSGESVSKLILCLIFHAAQGDTKSAYQGLTVQQLLLKHKDNLINQTASSRALPGRPVGTTAMESAFDRLRRGLLPIVTPSNPISPANPTLPTGQQAGPSGADTVVNNRSASKSPERSVMTISINSSPLTSANLCRDDGPVPPMDSMVVDGTEPEPHLLHDKPTGADEFCLQNSSHASSVRGKKRKRIGNRYLEVDENGNLCYEEGEDRETGANARQSPLTNKRARLEDGSDEEGDQELEATVRESRQFYSNV